MNVFISVMEGIIAFYKYEFVLFGYPLSLWAVIMWTLVAGILIKIVSAFFN